MSGKFFWKQCLNVIKLDHMTTSKRNSSERIAGVLSNTIESKVTRSRVFLDNNSFTVHFGESTTF